MQAMMASMGSPLPKEQVPNMGGGYGAVYDAAAPYQQMTVPMTQQVQAQDKAQMNQQMAMMQQQLQMMQQQM